jgi:CRISPR/Cas system-associated exonuclease Cas4 (RecB family)
MAFKNTLSWSHSTMKQYETCPRQYWFKKFGGWNGWTDRDSASERRRIWLLGKVQNRWMWRGDVLHAVIEEILRNVRAGHQPDPALILESTRERYRTGFRQSKRRQLLMGSSRAVGLAEHLFDRDIPNAEWKAFVDEAVAMLGNFLSSPVLARVRAVAPADWLALEELEKLEIDGVDVYVKMDAAWREEGVAVITDWKTGKGETDAEGRSPQLGLYALFAMERWGLPAKVREYHLADGSTSEWEPNEADREAVRALVARHLGVIRGKIRDGASGIEADAADFPATPSQDACRRCVYFSVCPESVVPPPPTPIFPEVVVGDSAALATLLASVTPSKITENT